MNTDADAIEHYLRGMKLEELRLYVGCQREILEGHQEAVFQGRTQGWRKGVADLQRFSMKFERFLNAYSEVIHIAQMADASYGGTATGFLTLLYTVNLPLDQCS